MVAGMDQPSTSARLRCGIVLGVQEDACEIIGEGAGAPCGTRRCSPRRGPSGSPPGHLVAVAIAPDGTEAVVFRWYDAVVLGDDSGQVRLWEPAHGDVVAQPRSPERPRRPGTRAYLSAGLPGAEWWVAGAGVDMAKDADVELGEVERFCTERDLWNRLV